MKRIVGRLNYRKRGSVAALAFVGCVPLICAIGGISVDSMHFNDARGALQRATDASALCGMQYMSKYKGTKSWGPATAQSNAYEDNVNYGVAVAAMNGVDGDGLYDNSAKQRTVAVELQEDATLPGYIAGRPNKCVATGSIYIRSLFAQFFGNFGQTVNTRSVAGYFTLNGLNDYAPLLVSWTDPDPDGKVLQDTPFGTPYRIIIKDMGDKQSNAIWLVSNGNVLKKYIDFLGGKGTRPSYDDVPAYKIGDTVKASNGEKGGAGQELGVLDGKSLPFLITDDNGIGVTAVQQPVHKVTRLIALTDIHVDATPGKDGYSITGTLAPAVANGTNDPNGTPNPVTGAAPYDVRLIQ